MLNNYIYIYVYFNSSIFCTDILGSTGQHMLKVPKLGAGRFRNLSTDVHCSINEKKKKILGC